MSRARDLADAGSKANYLDNVSADINTTYAPLASPDFTGTVDLTGTTVNLDNDQISGDKVSGGTIGAGTFNGTLGSNATHGNINLKRTKSYSGVFSNGNNGDTHNILTMQDPGFYVLNYSYWRNSPGSTINGVGEVAIQYVSSNFYTTVRRSESNVSNNIDVSNTGSTLQLLYNTSEPDGSFTVYYQYIVVASHDI